MKRFLFHAGGFLAGAASGFLLLVWFVYLIEPAYGGEDTLTVLIVAALGAPTSALLGGVFGIVWIVRAGRSDHPGRAVKLGLASSVALLVVLFAALPFLRSHVRSASRAAENREVRRLVGLHTDREQRRWEEQTVARYPREQSSLPALLGPLLYPGSRLVEWKDKEWEIEGMTLPPAWEIETATGDSADDVLAYYMSVLAEGIEGYPIGSAFGGGGEWSSWRGDLRSEDGRVTQLNVRGGDEGVRVGFETVSGLESGNDGAVAWPLSMEEYVARAARDREPYLEKLDEEFGDWLYPGATLLWGDLRSLKNVVYFSRDDMSKVVEYLAADDLEAEWTGEVYTFRRRESGARIPKFYVYPVHGGTRVHFRSFR